LFSSGVGWKAFGEKEPSAFLNGPTSIDLRGLECQLESCAMTAYCNDDSDLLFSNSPTRWIDDLLSVSRKDLTSFGSMKRLR
jgi:hypothetical protein